MPYVDDLTTFQKELLQCAGYDLSTQWVRDYMDGPPTTISEVDSVYEQYERLNARLPKKLAECAIVKDEPSVIANPRDQYKTPSFFNTLLTIALCGELDVDCTAAAGDHIIQAKRYITEAEDFLSLDTELRRDGEEPVRAFMNPPFSAGGKFLNRFVNLYNHGDIKAGVVLCLSGIQHNRQCWNAVDQASRICAWKGRLNFEPGHPDNKTRNGFDRDVIALYYGPTPVFFEGAFSPYGRITKQTN